MQQLHRTKDIQGGVILKKKLKTFLSAFVAVSMGLSIIATSKAPKAEAYSGNSSAKIKLGIDNLDNYLDYFKGKRVGLITNPSGMDSNFKSSIDVLFEKTKLTSLFAAEHGIRGDAQAGSGVGSEIDEITKVPIYSLYGKTKKPTPEMLKDVDVLTYDMQDVGARFYTYINTMAYAMEACAENNKTFVVFDRPNPIGGEQVQGSILQQGNESFVGMYPIVQRYGLTIGEYARYINKKFNINCDLKIVPMTGWSRDMYYDETGLKTWVMPSPNMPTLDTAIVYTGTCVFEGTNLSEGRGTTRPFELIGAPWIKPLELAKKLNSLDLPGVKFRAASFKPIFSKHSGVNCGGVQVYVTDREKFNSVKTGYAMLYTIRDMYPNDFKYLENNFIDKLVGNSYVREGKYDLAKLFEIVDKESNEFKQKVEPYKIYKEINKNNNHNKDEKVKLGIDNVDDYITYFKDKKVGLITNPSGMDSNFKSSIDVLFEKTKLTSLFAAEHGIRGDAQAGSGVGSEIDEITKVPIYSLYGKTKKPTPEMLKDVDVLTYDMQDVGARFYTYINTMAYAMEACAENNKTFVVFDRPNPIGGEQVQGSILQQGNESFVGMYPIVQRYGLTIGEYARYINKKFNINCDLKIVPMTGWSRDMYYDETGLKTWVMPSPNMPTLDTAIVYTGTCVFEGTNLSEGRGTTRPFELIGAPWIKPLELAKKLNSLDLPGVKFRAASFKPIFSKHSGVNCGGVQVYVTDREKFNSVKTGYAMLYTIRDMYPNDFKYLENNFIDKLVGNSYVREGKYDLAKLFEIVDRDSKEFEKDIEDSRIYVVNPDDVIKSVEKAEKTRDTKDVNDARTLVNMLPDGKQKTEFLSKLNNLEESIKLEAISKAIKAVKNAEETKSEEDIKNARDLVGKLQDGKEKEELINKLDALEKAIENEKEKENKKENENKNETKKDDQNKTAVDKEKNAKTQSKEKEIAVSKTGVKMPKTGAPVGLLGMTGIGIVSILAGLFIRKK